MQTILNKSKFGKKDVCTILYSEHLNTRLDQYSGQDSVLKLNGPVLKWSKARWQPKRVELDHSHLITGLVFKWPFKYNGLIELDRLSNGYSHSINNRKLIFQVIKCFSYSNVRYSDIHCTLGSNKLGPIL
jgi:hypothetical protein